MKKRVAMYYSGAKWQLDLFQFDKYRLLIDRLIYAPEISLSSLAPFDILLVPRESNQELLYQNVGVIREFLARGGTVISFGEITRPWLPGVSWNAGAPRFVYDGEDKWDKGYLDNKPMTIEMPEHPAFKGLEIDDLTWHFHGALVPPAGATPLLRYGSSQVIAFEHYPRSGGRIFAATLDPVLHAGYGVVKKTQKFLDAVLRWVRAEWVESPLIAVGANEDGTLWDDHFGVAPVFLLYDQAGNRIGVRANPHAEGANNGHHGNPGLILTLLGECAVWIGREINAGKGKRRSLIESHGVTIVSTAVTEADAAVTSYLTAQRV